jgi:adenylosuccinate synthase
MKADILLGLQWGDEGKGKIVDVLTPEYDIIARFQGGPNAGHTIEFDQKKFILHTIPSGIFNPSTINVVGNGVILDPLIMNRELDNLREHGLEPEKNLKISKKAHLILPTHRLLDAAYEKAKGKAKIGSTLKGIGPTYTDKTARQGIRIGNIFRTDFKEHYNALKESHLQILKFYNFDVAAFKIEGMTLDQYEERWFESVRHIASLSVIDSEYFINAALDEGKSLLAEGAQGTMLDVDFGTYPYVTSSNTITAGVCTGLGLAPQRIGEVFGIFKAYCTRVGGGPFPTEQDNEDGNKLREEGGEYGSTTGRPRRCGWLDLVALRYAIMLNGVTKLIMTKADVLNSFEDIRVGQRYKLNGKVLNDVPFEASYETLQPDFDTVPGWQADITSVRQTKDMPAKLNEYIRYIEHQTGVPLSMVSVGPDRTQVIRMS